MEAELRAWNVKPITNRAFVGVYVRSTVVHRNRGCHTSKDGSSANERSNEGDHCVKKIYQRSRTKIAVEVDKNKGALIFLPGNAKRVLYQRG